MKVKKQEVFDYLMDHPNSDSNGIMDHFKITPRQLSYQIKVINDDLLRNGYDQIRRDKTGRFVIDPNLFQYKMEAITDPYIEFFDREVRTSYILICIVANVSFVSLDDLTNRTKTSKKTIISDIRHWNENNALQIRYTRRHGYDIAGPEIEIRNLSFQTLDKMLANSDNVRAILSFMSLEKHVYDEELNKLSWLEKKINRKFVDNQLSKLSLQILLLKNRLISGNIIPNDMRQDNENIAAISEFKIITDMYSFIKAYPIQEKVYLTVLILITNIIQLDNVNEIADELGKACEVALNFEMICSFQFDKQEKEQFCVALIQHWLPAKYRIKYGFHVNNPLHKFIIEEYKYLYTITEQIIEPLVSSLTMPISDEERSLLTVFLGGWLQRINEKRGKKEMIEAIVICPSGTSISNLVFFNLKVLFPEIHFIGYYSLREYRRLEMKYDLVFSTVPLESKKPVISINMNFNEEYKSQLRKNVSSLLFSPAVSNIKISRLLNIVKENAQIVNENRLENELKSYIYPPKEITIYNESNYGDKNGFPDLLDLLKDKNIQIEKTSPEVSWQEYIKLSAKPLVEKGYIKERYVNNIIDIIIEDIPFLEIGKEAMIAHAAAGDAVTKTCVSLLQLDRPVLINNSSYISTIFTLATVNHHEHLKALNQIFDLLNNEDYLSVVRNAQTADEILRLVGNITA